jgi:hypothetical protein
MEVHDVRLCLLAGALHYAVSEAALPVEAVRQCAADRPRAASAAAA